MTDTSLIPPNYQTVMPDLIIKIADQFIAFVKEVFDATETYKSMRDVNTIMHAEIMSGHHHDCGGDGRLCTLQRWFIHLCGPGRSYLSKGP